MTYNAKTVYNNETQTVTTAGTNLEILGDIVTSVGTGIRTYNYGFGILRSGLYRISFDITFTPTGAGTEVLSIVKDGTTLPCAVAQFTAVDATTTTQHIETVIYVPTCVMIKPLIGVNISGVAGAVTHICASVVAL